MRPKVFTKDDKKCFIIKRKYKVIDKGSEELEIGEVNHWEFEDLISDEEEKAYF